jgi:exonuclease SbcD
VSVTATSDPVEVAGDFVAFATGGLPDDDERAVLTEAYEAAALALQREGDR